MTLSIDLNHTLIITMDLPPQISALDDASIIETLIQCRTLVQQNIEGVFTKYDNKPEIMLEAEYDHETDLVRTTLHTTSDENHVASLQEQLPEILEEFWQYTAEKITSSAR